MSRFFGVVVTVLLVAGLARAAEPVFVINQNLTQTLPISGQTDISVLISSPQEVFDVNVAIVQIRTPRGELLPVDLFTIKQPSSPLTSVGAPFSLVLKDSSRFRESGDHTISLRITGIQNKVAQAQLVSFIISVPVPTLSIARHQNATISAARWTPWSTTSVDETLRFEETSGRANVADLKVLAQDVYVKGTTELAGASIQITSDTNGQTLPANGQRDIHLIVTGLTRSGTMTTGLGLSSPTLATPITIPLQIEVFDRWPIPFSIIFAGVLSGAVVRHLTQVVRPREQARFRQSLLAAQLIRWRDRSRDLQQIQQLDAIDDILRRSDERLQLNDVPSATTLLDQAESAIAEFRKGWEQRFSVVLTRLRETATKIDELHDRIPTSEHSRIETARQEIANAQQAFSVFDVPLAESHIATAVKITGALSDAYPQAARRGLAPVRVQAIEIVVAPAEADRVAGVELSLTLDDPGRVIAAGDQFEWDFGDGSRLTTQAPQMRHRFLSAGAFRTRVTVMRGGMDVAFATGAIDVLARPIEVLLEQQRAGLRQIAAGLTLVSLAIAVLTGFGLLYIGKSFGTPQQYIEAFLWGFGIDSGVKNIADLMKKVS